MKGLLLAGGHGTRLRPLTFTGNKHLLPIANKPILFYGLENLARAGIREVGIILGPIKEGIVEAVGDGARFGLKVTYIHQPEPLGIAHAILIAEDFLRGEPFVVYLGDNLLKKGIGSFVKLFEEKQSDCVIGVTPTKEPQRFGVVEMENGRVVRLVEKPKQPRSNLALVGVYVFNDSVFEACRRIRPSWRGELEITDAIQTLIDMKKRVDVNFVEGWWKDTGKPEDLLEANQLVLQELEPCTKGSVEEGVVVTGNVVIGEGTVVRKESTIRGPVVIGRDCEIGPNVYIGPYTSIGDRTRIVGAEIENSIIMNDVVIECNRRIVDSIIGNHTTIIEHEKNRPRGFKFILGERTFASI
ncbi:MAG: glucose-1-phosphate thymidylyltransferase [Candidatus Terraquivivens tikiterensis]|uniref:Glucose-1-phosphate thymidylyltransferase n=1 Tax=Candidatus Terraquivivens tikiterensis TaxID=1980982 RepID=A0A2R7Y331_9ARCH|nr:MAG: glucose-1-phosphate thymidylyltransferase [Candidatus Terraquivivens tikiterensis]